MSCTQKEEDFVRKGLHHELLMAPNLGCGTLHGRLCEPILLFCLYFWPAFGSLTNDSCSLEVKNQVFKNFFEVFFGSLRLVDICLLVDFRSPFSLSVRDFLVALQGLRVFLLI